MSVLVEFGVPYPDLLQPGWGTTRSGGGIRAAELWGGELLPAARPRGLWQSPDGVLMLRPSALAERLEIDPAFEPLWMGLAQFAHAPGRWIESQAATGSRTRVMALQRVGVGDVAVTAPGATGAAAAFAVLHPDLACVLMSHNPLSVNEGIGITVQPTGTVETKHPSLCAVAYGGLAWQILGSGRVDVWRWDGGNWLYDYTAAITQGGFDPARPFSLAIQPYGADKVALIASGQPGGDERRGRFGGDEETAGAVYSRPDAGWSEALGQSVKTTATPLWVYLPRETAAPAITICRSRFWAADLTMAPDWAEESRPAGTAAASQVLGIVGQTSGVGAAARIVRAAGDSTPGARLVGGDGAPWNGHEYIAAAMRLEPSAGGLYSPEVWGVSYEIAARQNVPTSVPVDGTAFVRDLEITWTDEPTADYCELQFRASPDALPEALSVPGNIRVLAEGVTIFEGDIIRRQTVVSDPLERLKVDMTLTCESLWGRFERIRLGGFRALAGRSVRDIILQAMARAGVAAHEVVFHEPELLDFPIGSVGSPSEVDMVEPDQSVADLLRGLGEQFGLQGRSDLQFRRAGGLWHVYFTSAWLGELPSLIFYSGPGTGAPESEAVRRAGDAQGRRWLKVLNPSLEFDSRRPDFNHLLAEIGIGSGADARVARVSIAPRPSVLTDETSSGYQGGVRRKVASGGPLAVCRTEADLARVARKMYDREMLGSVSCTLTTEWAPIVQPGQLFGLRVGDTGCGVWRLTRVAARFPIFDAPHLYRATVDAEWVGPEPASTGLVHGFEWPQL